MFSKVSPIRYFVAVVSLSHALFATGKAEASDSNVHHCTYEFNTDWHLNQKGRVLCSYSPADYSTNQIVKFDCSPNSCTFNGRSLGSDLGKILLPFPFCAAIAPNNAIPNPGQGTPIRAYGYVARPSEGLKSITAYSGVPTKERSSRTYCDSTQNQGNAARVQCNNCRQL